MRNCPFDAQESSPKRTLKKTQVRHRRALGTSSERSGRFQQCSKTHCFLMFFKRSAKSRKINDKRKNSKEFHEFSRPHDNVVHKMQNEHFRTYMGADRDARERQTCESSAPVQAKRLFRRSAQRQQESALKCARDGSERALGVTSGRQRVQVALFLQK